MYYSCCCQCIWSRNSPGVISVLSLKNLQKYSEVVKPHSLDISLIDLSLVINRYLEVCSLILARKVAGGTPVSLRNSFLNHELLTHRCSAISSILIFFDRFFSMYCLALNRNDSFEYGILFRENLIYVINCIRMASRILMLSGSPSFATLRADLNIGNA